MFNLTTCFSNTDNGCALGVGLLVWKRGCPCIFLIELHRGFPFIHHPLSSPYASIHSPSLGRSEPDSLMDILRSAIETNRPQSEPELKSAQNIICMQIRV
eukprot:TRINITY_DN6372_c0_g1_i1.p1 TRINITY_DN6372_c0_g1~~TRINITY_DN6372_c0_g1_i1.p1  ORF type:complete len:100 (-),score=8.64 TRINITY_DN6372_c0_g1_i1:63-362(-)